MTGGTLGKWIVFFGLGLLVIGLIILLANKVGIHFGKLPGDVEIKREKFKIYFPIVTSIIISIILTILFNLIRFIKK